MINLPLFLNVINLSRKTFEDAHPIGTELKSK